MILPALWLLNSQAGDMSEPERTSVFAFVEKPRNKLYMRKTAPKQFNELKYSQGLQECGTSGKTHLAGQKTKHPVTIPAFDIRCNETQKI